MAVLALAVAGAQLGTAAFAAAGVTSFLGMSGASIGWLAGSMLGQALFTDTPSQQGPRITDLSVQASTYGTAIPRGWGTFKAAGNVIWCTDKRERAKTEEVGGKGGGTEVTTYTYDVDIAIALCYGPAKIRKIYNAGKLVADFSDGASVDTLNASAVGAEGFTFYPGDEAQLPDPTIEADKGVGNVPAYRGLCYIVFERLACPNGQIPQLSFEVAVGGAEAIVSQDTDGTLAPDPGQRRSAAFTSDLELIGGWTHTGEGIPFTAYFEGVSGEGSRLVTQVGTSDENVALLTGGTDVPGAVYRTNDGDEFVFLDKDGRQTRFPVNLEITPGVITWRRMDDVFVFFAPPLPGDTVSNVQISRLAQGWGEIIVPPGGATWCWVTSTLIYLGGGDYEGGGDLWVASYDRDTLIEQAVDHWTPGTSGKPSTMSQAVTYEEGQARLWLAETLTTQTALWRFDGLDWTLAAVVEGTTSSPLVMHVNGQIVNIGCFSSDDFRIRTINLQAINAVSAPLADVVTEICQLAGVTAVDVSALDVDVDGYVITRVSTARAALEPLVRAFFLDVVETDGELRFIPRADQPVTLTIPYDDLGAAEAGSDPAEPFALERVNADELPRSITINYISQALEYEAGTETASRSTVTHGADVVDEIPVVFSDATRPAAIAQAMLYEAWAAQNLRKLSLTRRYAHLDAGDHVHVEYPVGVTTRVRLTQITDTGVLIQADCVPVEPAVYVSSATAATPSRSQSVVSLAGDSELVLLDIPLLRDADDSAAPYAAMSGWRAAWGGATLYMGPTETGLVAQGSVSRRAVIGTILDAPGDWHSGLVDESSVLRLRLLQGTLAGQTHAQMLSGRDNVVALGAHGRWEIAQFRDATQDDDGYWVLTGLRRGLRGTEHNRGSHTAGDSFVLLADNGLLRPAMEVAQIDASQCYRAVTLGQALSAAATQTFTCAGEALTPLSPTDLRAQRESDGAITFTWSRRSRYADNWLAGIVPLAEASQSWVITIDGARVLTSTTPTVTYTMAQQTADGGLWTAGTVVVEQVSASVGVGHALTQAVVIAA